MSETYEFVAATPVKRAARSGAGRKKDDNPFEAGVKAILGTDEARATTFTLDVENGETFKQRKDRIRRLLTRAGKECVADGQDPATIKLAIVPVEGSENTYTATFWHYQP